MAVAAIVLVGLYLVVDVVALQYLKSRGASEVAEAMAAERASVNLGGLPFLPSLMRGRLRSAEVAVTGASGAGGLRVQTVQARMIDVRFDADEVFSLARSRFSGRTKVRGREPIGRVEIIETDLEEYLRRRVPSLQGVDISSSGIELRFVVPPDVPIVGDVAEEVTPTARLLPRLEERRLVLRLVGVSSLPDALVGQARLAAGSLELPPIPIGLSTDLNLGNGVLVVEASGPSVELDIGEGELA